MRGTIMARKKNTQEIVEDQVEEQDEYDQLIEDSDYGFIISSSGELKTFFCPDQVDGWPPKEIVKIFKIFKITDLSAVLPGSGTIH